MSHRVDPFPPYAARPLRLRHRLHRLLAFLFGGN